jgi:hypothetical protein
VLDNLVEMVDLRGRDSGRRQALFEFGRTPTCGVGGDDSIAFVAVADPRDVGGEPRIIGQLRHPEDVGDQGSPAPVVLHADEDFAVAGRVGVIGAIELWLRPIRGGWAPVCICV